MENPTPENKTLEEPKNPSATNNTSASTSIGAAILNGTLPQPSTSSEPKSNAGNGSQPGQTKENAVTIDDDEEEDAEEEEQEEYDVEAIRARRKNPKTGLYEYLVKWENYPESQNTWEPIDNLKCPDIIARFNETQKAKRKRGPGNGSPASQDQSPLKRTKKTADKGRNSLSNAENGNDRARTNRRFTDVQPSAATKEPEEPFLIEEENADTDTLSLSSGGSNQDKSKQTKDLSEPRHQEVKGFERGLDIERIVGSCLDDNEKLWFFVKWKGLDQLELVESDEIEEKAPRILCCWYKERLYYAINNPNALDQSDKRTSISELPAATDVS